MSDWMPIETAPKDGTQVLCTWEHTWRTSGPHVEVCEVGDAGRWFYSYDGDEPKTPPTHWQPLPPPPTKYEPKGASFDEPMEPMEGKP